MNAKEQKTAAGLLEKINGANSQEVVQYATAYELVTRAGCSRDATPQRRKRKTAGKGR